MVAALIMRLKDVDAQICFHAAMLLGKASNSASEVALVEHSLHDGNAAVRRACLSALGVLAFYGAVDRRCNSGISGPGARGETGSSAYCAARHTWRSQGSSATALSIGG